MRNRLKDLKLIEEKSTGSKTSPFLDGQKNRWGIMPDWNPAEIIGVRPKPLALSLYRDLITDSIWAYQRQLRVQKFAKFSAHVTF